MKKIVRNQEYDPKVLKKLHDLQLEMLQDLEKICDKYNLKYFAVFGTALGAVRHNGFIPWDDDMDVGMLRKDYEIFIRVVEKEMGDKYQIMTPEIDKNYACCVTKFQRKGTKFVSYLSDKLNCDQCIFIDVFPFDYIAPTKRKRKSTTAQNCFFRSIDLFMRISSSDYSVYGNKKVCCNSYMRGSALWLESFAYFS